MSLCLIGFGSNLGDRAALLRQAVLGLAALPEVRLVAESCHHASTPAGGPPGQGEFLNAAALFETTLAPIALLAALQHIEDELGRVREQRWGPRTIDLDLLLYDDLQLATPDLTLPHPRMAFRRFVLAGAVEIAPHMRHPEIGWTLSRLWEHVNSAPNYVALAGANPAIRRELARQVARNAPAQAIFLPEATGFEASAALVQMGDLLQASAWRELFSSGGEPSSAAAISDFWFEEIAAQLAAPLSDAVRSLLEDEMRRLRPQLISPKLLVRLGAGGKKVSAAFEGPQLHLDAHDLNSAVAEATAAIQAMR